MQVITKKATRVLPAGSWPIGEEIATVTLAHDDRHRRRIVLTCDDGQRVMLDLAEATVMNDGDGLALDNGGIVRVAAAAQEVADIVCGTPRHLARLAWHLGNRHLAVQVVDEHTLRIAWDHVIAAMAEGLGATVTHHQAAFHPESGAYAHESGGHAYHR